MSSNPAAIILGAIQLIREAAKAIEQIQRLTEDGPKDLSNDELASIKQQVDSSYANFTNLLRDRGID